MEIRKQIAWRGNEYGFDVDEVVVNIDAKEYDKLARASILVKENGWESVRIVADGWELLYDGKESEFKADAGIFIVYSCNVYFYAQNKWEASYQIESEEITFEEIIESIKN